MIFLLTASLIWAFSFGLIKNNLTSLDPVFISTVRIFLSLLIFIPFIKIKDISFKLKVSLMITGAVQYGLMYIFYIYSYRYLKGYEVALFTIFTPVYISLIHSLDSGKLNRVIFILSIISVAGAGIVIYSGISSPEFLKGFFVLQLSNISFSWGQLKYRKIMRSKTGLRDIRIFGYLYAGAFILTSTVLLVSGKISFEMTGKQLFTLLYLGIIASGMGFFLWNLGAKLSRVGTLSVFNNIKIPLAIAVSLLIFGEKANVLQLITGGTILILLVVASEKISSSLNNNS